jgi:OmpA-OmpF porin, OOP family
MQKLVLAAVLATGAAHANYDYSHKWGLGGSYGYNTPVFGHLFNDSADGDQAWSVHGRYHYNSAYGVEGAFSRYEFSDVTTALKTYDVLFFNRLRPTSRLTPVLGLGAGATEIPNYGDESTKLHLKARAGLEYSLLHCLTASLNVDYVNVHKMLGRNNLDGRNIHDLSARVGLTWYFGTENKAAPAAAAAPVVAGVSNYDTDGDGVADRKDKCPNTPAGSEVNAYGCLKQEKASVRLDVQFAVGKSALDHRYDSDLKELANFLKEHPATKVEVQGHTDNTGSKALNKKLSQTRADAVKAYLVKELGADASRLVAKGYGDEQPVGDNSTDEGKKQNRRVVAIITE